MIQVRLTFFKGEAAAQTKAHLKTLEILPPLFWAPDLALATMKSKRQRNIESTGFLGSHFYITTEKMFSEQAILHIQIQ